MPTRRGVLTFAAGLSIGGFGLAAATDNLPNGLNSTVENASDALSLDRDLWDQEFTSHIVARIEFERDGTMHVTLAETHGLDGFAIWHAADDIETREPIASKGMGIGAEEFPRFSGVITLNIANALASHGVEFPSNQFRLVGLTGAYLAPNVEGKLLFKVPHELMPSNRTTLDPSAELGTQTEEENTTMVSG